MHAIHGMNCLAGSIPCNGSSGNWYSLCIVSYMLGCGDRWCSQEGQTNQVLQNLRRVYSNHIQC
jgi:hypothetical protein